MKKYLIAGVGALALIASMPANAAGIVASSTGIASPATTITFDEVPLSQNVPVTNEFASLGVSFINGSAWFSPQTGLGNVQGNDVGNFTSTGNPSFGPLTLAFTWQQTSAAFAMASNSSQYLFEALNGNTVVDSFQSAVPAYSFNDYFGFTGVSFNSIRITNLSSDYYLIDSVQLGSTSNGVPEPATWAMMIFGFGLAGASLRRRRAVAA